jgi:hypothetical protein
MNEFDYEPDVSMKSKPMVSEKPPRKTKRSVASKTPKKRRTSTCVNDESPCIEIVLDEENIADYLRENPDNIILNFGETVNCTTRSNLQVMIDNPQHNYQDMHGNKYVQIIGRYLIEAKDIPKFMDDGRSIYNISTLINVINVFSDANPGHKHNRSVYDVQAYTVEDLVNSM